MFVQSFRFTYAFVALNQLQTRIYSEPGSRFSVIARTIHALRPSTAHAVLPSEEATKQQTRKAPGGFLPLKRARALLPSFSFLPFILHIMFTVLW